ncbi:6-bladed beta-propeller [Gracilimonas aurantiaca]|uniref:6-bladed beta-propeller n=1 Tax=Gracilimonas aurantiaca TaxID=3234185 RepID=UPI00390C4E54
MSSCSKPEDRGPVVNENGVLENPSSGLWQDQAQFPVEIEEVGTLDLSAIEELVITSATSLSFDEVGNLYFYDRNLTKIISLDQEGKLRWAVGQEGKGPGDFENPFGMVLYNNKLYIANIQGTRLDEFDLEGNFIRSTDLAQDLRFASLSGVRNDGLFVFTTAKFGTIGTEIVTLRVPEKDSIEVVSRFDVIETTDEKYKNASSRGSVVITGDEIWYSHSVNHQHKVYDYNGNLLRSITRDFDGALGPGVYQEGGSISIFTLGRLGPVTFLEDGSYLIRTRYPLNIDDPNEYAKKASTGSTDPLEYKVVMDLYNANGELLYVEDDTEMLESYGSLSRIGPDGYYYSVFPDELLIKKYRVNLSR